MEISEKVLAAVKEAAPEGFLSCAAAQKLALELGVSCQMIGSAADHLEIKIHSCQLGCF